MERNGLVRVRMTRHVAGYTQAVDLEADEVYELTPDKAAQFLANGMGVVAEGEGAGRLEAAALATGRRRG